MAIKLLAGVCATWILYVAYLILVWLVHAVKFRDILSDLFTSRAIMTKFGLLVIAMACLTIDIYYLF